MNIILKKIINDKLEKIIIVIGSLILIYLLISLYFSNHFFFHTVINGVNVSLKSYDNVDFLIINYVNDYKLLLISRDGRTEEISAQDLGLQYNEANSITKIYKIQKSLEWMKSLFKGQKYGISDLFIYKQDKLSKVIDRLDCLNNNIIESQNVRFEYVNVTYELVKEVYGNKIKKDKLIDTIYEAITYGKAQLNLDEMHCYEDPKYTRTSEKTVQTLNALNKYVSTIINYQFGDRIEILDGSIINKWLKVDEELEVQIDELAIMDYVIELSYRYDTVGVTRDFITSIGKTVEIKGGLYGWKIDKDAEVKVILEHIKLGNVIEKEPIYIQRALYREEDDIGNTYIEINITRQHLWYYKEGKLIIHGPIVTGNPNKGNATILGAYMLNYKQKGAVLKGPNYEVGVTYWMPFYGNIGLHDASWRQSFGGEIYKRRGTHGCVNAPKYLARTIYDSVEAGIPIIIYEE